MPDIFDQLEQGGVAVADAQKRDIFDDVAEKVPQKDIFDQVAEAHAPYSRTNPKPLTSEQEKLKRQGGFLHELLGGSFLDQTPESLTALGAAGPDATRVAMDTNPEALTLGKFTPGSINYDSALKSAVEMINPALAPLVESKGFEDRATAKPLITLPKPSSGSVASGILRGVETLGEGLTSTENIGLMASIGGAPAAFQKAAAGAFGLQMLHEVPGQIQAIAEANTPSEIAEKTTEALGTAAMALLGGIHGAIGRAGRLETNVQMPTEAPRVPPPVPAYQEQSGVNPSTVEGLVLAKEKLGDNFFDLPPEQQASRREQTSEIDKQLAIMPKEEVAAAVEKIATRDQSPPPAEEAVPPVSEASPPAEGGTAERAKTVKDAYFKVFNDRGAEFPAVPISEVIRESGLPAEEVKQHLLEQRAAGELTLSRGDYSISTPEERAAIIPLHGEDNTLVRYHGDHYNKPRDDAPPVDEKVAKPAKLDEAMVKAVAASVERIADQETAGQPTIVRDAARDAALKKAIKNMEAGEHPMSFVKSAAKEAAGEEAKKQGISLEAESETGHSVANTVASPDPAVENTEAISAMQKAIDSTLSKRDAKILRAHMEGTSMEEIGKAHGVTKARVSQIVEKSLPKIRKAMEKEGITKEDIAPVEAEDWTQATAEPKSMKRGGKEKGAALVPKIVIPDRKMSPLDKATTERSAKLQRSTDDAHRAQKEVQKIAPKEEDQGGISLWIEANGDMSKLKAWEAGAKGEVFKKAAKAAQNLTLEQVVLAKKIQSAFKILESRGNKYDVLKSHRDNYVPHVWEVEKGKPIFGSARLKDKFKFAKARTFEDFAAGDAAGFKPKTLSIGKLLPAYLHEMNKVIADRQFVEDISNRNAKDGRPLVVPRGRVSDISPDSGGKAYLANPRALKTLTDDAGNKVDTSDYKTLESQPALHDWRWEGKDKDGNPIFMRDDLAVHPEVAKRINSMLGKSAIREWYDEPGEGLSQVPKVLVKGLDTAQSVMKREMFSTLAPFHQVQEGTHAVGHVINPFFNIPKVDLRNPAQLDAARHGLMLLSNKTSSNQFLEGVGGKGGFISQALRKFGGKPGEVVAEKILDAYQDYLFHQYIPGLKFKTYEAMVERNSKRYAKELASGKILEADVKLLSAEQANAAYGHLNYALLDRNPTMQHFLQLGLLAPDFLEARGRFVGQAAKALIGAKGGREQLKAIAVLALVQAGISYTFSQLPGFDKWDPTHPFEVVYKGRRYTMRSIPEDLDRLLAQGPDQRREFVSARVNPVAQKIDQLRTGLNYRGEKTTATDTMEELLASYIPITARALPGVRQLTESSRQNPITPLEQLAGSFGLKVSRYSPISETYKSASEWMEKNGIPKDKGSYPVSKYQQLRYALEDGDLSKAADEWNKLKEGTTKQKLADGFKESISHPFTQNKAMDHKFRASLPAEDRAKFDLAERKREQILSAFTILAKYR